MSTVTVKEKNGKITHFLDSYFKEISNKIVVVHNQPDEQFGGLMQIVARIFEKTELQSIEEQI